jgi:hypothetical protein
MLESKILKDTRVSAAPRASCAHRRVQWRHVSGPLHALTARYRGLSPKRPTADLQAVLTLARIYALIVPPLRLSLLFLAHTAAAPFPPLPLSRHRYAFPVSAARSSASTICHHSS